MHSIGLSYDHLSAFCIFSWMHLIVWSLSLFSIQPYHPHKVMTQNLHQHSQKYNLSNRTGLITLPVRMPFITNNWLPVGSNYSQSEISSRPPHPPEPTELKEFGSGTNRIFKDFRLYLLWNNIYHDSVQVYFSLFLQKITS